MSLITPYSVLVTRYVESAPPVVCFLSYHPLCDSLVEAAPPVVGFLLYNPLCDSLVEAAAPVVSLYYIIHYVTPLWKQQLQRRLNPQPLTATLNPTPPTLSTYTYEYIQRNINGTPVRRVRRANAAAPAAARAVLPRCCRG
jgi:hypothetical protein